MRKLMLGGIICFSSVQLLSCVQLFMTKSRLKRREREEKIQASLSITNSRSLLKLMSMKSVMPSNHLFLCHPLLLPSIFPSIRVFSNEFFSSGGQSVGASASASVLAMNIQGWFPLGLTGFISPKFKGHSRVFKNINPSVLILQCSYFFMVPDLTSIHDY